VLTIRNLTVNYGLVPAVVAVDIEIKEAEVLIILGANGAGKSTIVKSIMGLRKPTDGSIVFRGGQEIHKLESYLIHRLGISWVPEGREIWGTLSVLDNLRMGAFTISDRKEVERHLRANFELFPILEEKKNQLASLLSGGQQQQLAIARCLMSDPKLILMDEPSLGLAPIAVNQVFELVRLIKQRGISVLMVEQHAQKALQVADNVLVIEMGRFVDRGGPAEIAARGSVKDLYFGSRSQSD
jgi:branched-chain amino acid transport system ATP-binding protein